MSISEILPLLCRANGVSGREDDISRVFGSLISPFCGDARRDAMGNTFYGSKYNCGRKTVMLEAHADKIGFMVSHITKQGFVLFSPIGGTDRKILPASRVRIYGKETVNGVIDCVPPHLKEKQTFKSEDLCIDTGFTKSQLEGKIDIGDPIEFTAQYTPLADNKAASPALDDRAGLAVLIRTLELVKDKSKYDIVAVSTVQEEAGCRGARAAAESIKPDVCICIDVTHGTTPDAADDTFEVGKGPAIGVGPNMTPCITNWLRDTAKETQIPFQLEVMGGSSGTNAWVIQLANGATATGLVSVPLKYMHTPYEVLSLSDIEDTARLLSGLLQREVI